MACIYKPVSIGYQNKDVSATCPVEAKLWNARQLLLPAELAVNGFQLVKLQHGVTDFSSEAQLSGETEKQIKQRMYPAFEKLLLKKCPGASKVVVFNHGLRASSVPQAPKAVPLEEFKVAPMVKAPVKEAHSDFSASVSPLVVKKLLPDVDPATHRYALINLWMSADQQNPVMKTPLAFLDAQTVSHEEMVDMLTQSGKNRQMTEWTGEMDAGFRSKIKQLDSSTENSKHGWFYFPKMLKDEAVIFKQYDSSMEEAQVCIHAAIDLEETGPQPTPSRQSIEVRALVLYPNAEEKEKSKQCGSTCMTQ